MRRAASALTLLSALVLAGCTGHSKAPTAQSSQASQPAGLGGGGGEQTSSPTPPRSTIVTTPRPTLSSGAGSEIDAACPYVSNQEWANAEGNRVGRSVQLATKPVGCRFYFQYDPNQITGEITVQRLATPTQAFNAVVTASTGHPEFVDDKDIGDHGSIARRMALQGNDTWECVFSKGTLVVTVHTSQANISDNARTLARLIAPTIH
jgi:hypothetical protein